MGASSNLNWPYTSICMQAARNPKLARVIAALQQATLLQYWTVRCSAAAGLAKVMPRSTASPPFMAASQALHLKVCT